MTEDIATAAALVLTTADPAAKRKAARKVARDWRLGRLDWRFDAIMPERPARPDRPELLPPNKMPKRGTSARGRVALLHALAHIEFVAIDLAFDMVGRFGAAMPRAFTDDWVRVGADEAMHFALLERRLRQVGSFYGALPAHDGLWSAAIATADDVLARLAVAPMLLEARGLDVTPATIQRCESAGDESTARILRRILSDEVRHVRAGRVWFEFGCAERRIEPVTTWQILAQFYFRGAVKPPFNDSAREAAGLTRNYYQPLACGPGFPPLLLPSGAEGLLPE